MKVTYLGTGAAEGIPALFCNCEYCKGVKARGGREIRSRAQVLLDDDFCVDFPPDAFYHAAHLKVDLSQIRYLIVTHTHIDHFYPQDLILRGYKYAYDMGAEELTLFGNEEMKEIYFEGTRRELRDCVKEHITVLGGKAFTPVTLGEYTVHPLKARHTSREPFVYLIEKGDKRVLHLTDTGKLPEEDYEYLRSVGKRIDLITFDCTFLYDRTQEDARHMGLDENLRTAERLSALGLVDDGTKKVITHFSHNARPSAERLIRAEGMGFLAAYDGLEVQI